MSLILVILCPWEMVLSKEFKKNQDREREEACRAHHMPGTVLGACGPVGQEAMSR